MKNMATSLSFFSALVDCNKSLLAVIVDLVLYALSSKKIFSFSISDATKIINQFYSFDFPDAVIKRACKKMVRDGVLSRDKNATYVVENAFDIGVNKKEKVFSDLQHIHNEVCEKLYLYCKNVDEESDKDEVINCLFDFILFEASHSKNSDTVSAFLLSIEHDEKYINYLNSIRSALVIYRGVCSSPSFSDEFRWNDELNLFLNTDVLFSAYGLNGEYKKKLFEDFHIMAKEINIASRLSKKKELIKFYYFDKINDEIDNFYYMASQVVQNKVTLDPNKNAMAEIVKGCSSESDIIEKKSKFKNFLSSIGIKCFNEDINIADYVVENNEIKCALKKDLKSRNIQFDEDEVELVFSHLTKMNALRKGNSACPFGKAKYFFVTDKFLTNYIASHESVKFNSKDIPLSTNVDFLTAKLWFTLGKCFSNKNKLATFDVIINTKLAIESTLTVAIDDCFQKIKGKLKKGEITKDEACQLYIDLRKKAIAPEEISEDNIDDIIAFCTNNRIEILKNEHSMLNERLQKAENYRNRLFDIYKEELFENNKKNTYRYLAKGLTLAFHISIYVTLLGTTLLISYILYNIIYSESGSVKNEFSYIISPGILSGVISTLLCSSAAFFKRKRITSLIEKKIVVKYRQKLHKKREVLKKKYLLK